jgi:DNA-binding response OmpR family regulator
MDMKRVLIIEDEVQQMEALRIKFMREGFGVIEAINGVDGLATALREHPDIILLDIILPKMDGMTMLKKLREDEWGKTSKVVILTNLSDDERVLEAARQGTHEYLVKADWRIDDVVRKVRERLGMNQ